VAAVHSVLAAEVKGTTAVLVELKRKILGGWVSRPP
jgi:hypothetical protein